MAKLNGIIWRRGSNLSALKSVNVTWSEFRVDNKRLAQTASESNQFGLGHKQILDFFQCYPRCQTIGNQSILARSTGIGAGNMNCAVSCWQSESRFNFIFSANVSRRRCF